MTCIAEASPQQVEFLSHGLSGTLPHDANWHVVVVELPGGREILNSGTTTGPLAPASLMKLITAGAVFERDTQGKPVMIDTEILHDGTVTGYNVNGNIYLRGNGNCLLTAHDLIQAARTLRDRHITTLTGKIVADATRFDTRSLERSGKGAGHAPVSALGLDLHTVSITITPAQIGQPPVITVEPPNDEVRFAVSARTISGGRNTLEVIQSDDNGYRVSGEITKDSGPSRWRFSLADPTRYAAQSFRTILIREGVLVQGEATTGAAPPGAVLLTTIQGPDMKRFVAEMNTHSLNVAADNLLLALGGAVDGEPATRGKGLAVLKEHLARHGISTSEATIVDGSGLLPGNRITSSALAHYLAAIARQPWFPSLYHGLPRAGMDGTLRNGAFRNERFRVKSGSLENVAALAGYGVDKSGREIAFAFIVNTPGPLPPTARNAGDDIMDFLANEVLQ